MTGRKWILLVAGSKDWENYRHQANVCGLYQIIKKHGIPDEQIVVMMYDDIAYNSKNPENGQIISVVDDSNVYLGVPKDYTGKHLTPDNFLAALRGDKSTGKKVIDSGPDDNIYVYMSGLGKEGSQHEGAFKFLQKALSPDAFMDTLKSMQEGKKFSKMVIFMESDYSATMFTDFPKGVDVYALASCHASVQLCPSNYNKEMDVYLSDQFSSAWLKHLSTVDFTKSTFDKLISTKQSKHLEANPDGPCPCQFGNMEIVHCHLSEFLQE